MVGNRQESPELLIRAHWGNQRRVYSSQRKTWDLGLCKMPSLAHDAILDLLSSLFAFLTTAVCPYPHSMRLHNSPLCP